MKSLDKGADNMSIIAAVAVPHPPIILPEIGLGEERKIEKSAAAYMDAMRRVSQLMPDTIVITSPHSSCIWIIFIYLPDGREGATWAGFTPAV
jgi:hypothetical protein